MDQNKIGKFIAEMRKSQGLTQKELGEQLGLSDKAVSKWECGKGLPDNSIMLNLCEILNISVNELLSGERLSSSDYNRKAEENMMSLIQETKDNKDYHKRDALERIIGELFLLLLIILAIIISNGISGIPYFFDIPTLFIITAIIMIMLLSTKMTTAFFKSFQFFIRIKDTVSVKELEKSLLAVKLVAITSCIACAIELVICIIAFLHSLSDPYTFGPYIAVACLSVFYSAVICLCLIPVAIKLKLAINEFSN